MISRSPSPLNNCLWYIVLTNNSDPINFIHTKTRSQQVCSATPSWFSYCNYFYKNWFLKVLISILGETLSLHCDVLLLISGSLSWTVEGIEKVRSCICRYIYITLIYIFSHLLLYPCHWICICTKTCVHVLKRLRHLKRIIPRF